MKWISWFKRKIRNLVCVSPPVHWPQMIQDKDILCVILVSSSVTGYVCTWCLRAQSLSCQTGVCTEISAPMWRGAAGSVLQRGLRPPSWLMRQDSSVKSSSAFTDPCRESELLWCGGKGRNLAFSPVRDVVEDRVRTREDLNHAAHGWYRVNKGTSCCNNAWSLGTARLEAQVLRWCPGAAGSAPSPRDTGTAGTAAVRGCCCTPAALARPGPPPAKAPPVT